MYVQSLRDDYSEDGPQGPTGPQGDVGATGPQGVVGDIGATGPQGVVGATGPQGVVGAVGSTGPQGVDGVVGAVGATGPQGTTGPQGALGFTGPQGDVGAVGDVGATGPQGAVGPTGPQGAAAPTDDAERARLDDVQSRLETLIADIDAAGALILVDVFNTSNGLTDNSLVTFTSQHDSNPAYSMWNGRYGPNLPSEYYGWQAPAGTQSLTIEGIMETGHYNYVDLGSVAPFSIIKAFELWAAYYQKPLDFFLIGSNDLTSSWTKLYDSNGVNILKNRVVGSNRGYNKYHSDAISIPNRTHFRYVGLFGMSSFSSDSIAGDGHTPVTGLSCQELRLLAR